LPDDHRRRAVSFCRHAGYARGRSARPSPLDRAGVRDVNVNGTGKIEVDFKNVPKGVRTRAEGEGLFKSTEVSRYSAMTEADVGPGAGEE
jgi:hypothetical protein